MNLTRIIVATDFSDSSLNALETAFSLAQESGATLHLVHVMEPPIPLGGMAGPVLPPQWDSEQEELIKRMEELIPSNWDGSVEVERNLLTGNPAEAISAFAKELDADMIVVGTHGRKGLARILLGSTAEALLRSSPCQVLVVKHKSAPDGSGGE